MPGRRSKFKQRLGAEEIQNGKRPYQLQHDRQADPHKSSRDQLDQFFHKHPPSTEFDIIIAPVLDHFVKVL